MAGNTFGKILKLTTFGESHGSAIGGILDGCPAGLPLTEADLQKDLDLRKPGFGHTATKRKEPDQVQILSGIFEGKTTGTPLAFYIVNQDHHSQDYGELARMFRPGHADWSYFCKYNGIRDYRGGGRASGRETAVRVAAGAVAKKMLALHWQIEIAAATVELGGIGLNGEPDFEQALSRPYFAGQDSIIPIWNEAVDKARKNNDSLGGIVEIVCHNIPAGLGEPVFDKLDAVLAHAIMSVGAVKGVEIGAGFSAARLPGSQNNDQIYSGDIHSLASFGSNNAGGILGGISSGQDIIIRAAVKPIASIGREQDTIDVDGKPAKIIVGGRHDLSAIPRIVPVLSAMTALAIADACLMQKRMEIAF